MALLQRMPGRHAIAAVLLAVLLQFCEGVTSAAGRGLVPDRARGVPCISKQAAVGTLVEPLQNAIRLQVVGLRSASNNGAQTEGAAANDTQLKPLTEKHQALKTAEMNEQYDETAVRDWLFILVVALLLAWLVEHFSPEHHGEAARPERGLFANSLVPINFYALSLVASVQQAYVPSGLLSAWLVILGTLLKAFMQILALFLTVGAIDPLALPVTSEPNSPWVSNPWSVNCMKWLMVILLAVFMVDDTGECSTFLEAVLLTNRRRLSVPKVVLLGIGTVQLAIALTIVWGGVVVVLSFQNVPDILYSAMAIKMIAKVDRAFFHMLLEVFCVTGNFLIIHGHTMDENAMTPRSASMVGHIPPTRLRDNRTMSDSLSADKPPEMHIQRTLQELIHEPIDYCVHLLLRFMVLLPFAFALGLTSRAFLTGVIPSRDFHQLWDLLDGISG